MAEEYETNRNYLAFIEGLIQKTKAHDIDWRYLDENHSLYEGMHWTNCKTEFSLLGSKERVYPDFDTEDSFYTRQGDMYIVLYTVYNQPTNLYVVPNTYKKVVRMDAGEYGDLITRLLNLVISQFPNAEDFISKFVSGNQ